MTKVLVHYSDNWADEMDVDGFAFFKCKEDWESYKSTWEKYLSDKESQEWYIGTNEAIEIDQYTFKRCFDVVEITDAEYETLKKAFDGKMYLGTYGFFPPSPEDFDDDWEELSLDDEDE